MTKPSRPPLAIGELARRTGVSVKTIRFYSNQGVLPPADVTDAGYRRYSEGDVVRLETVRTLRAAGFDIATIRQVMDQHLAPDAAMRIQIRAIELQERTLRRQRLMLERALARDDVPGHPERSRALALLSSAERSAFLRNQIASGMEDVRVNSAWLHDFQNAAVEDIPEELDDDQLEAWVELVEMTSDPSFATAINQTAQPFWNEIMHDAGMNVGTWQQRILTLTNAARQAVREGVSPDSSAARHIVQVWSRDLASDMDPIMISRLLKHMVATHDPRLAHYWRLIAAVNRRPWDEELHHASLWMVEAIRHLPEAGGCPD